MNQSLGNNTPVPLTEEQLAAGVQAVLRAVYAPVLVDGQALNVSVPPAVSFDHAVEAAARAYLEGLAYRPDPITEQSCLIMKTGSNVVIECENGDDAETMFNWIVDDE